MASERTIFLTQHDPTGLGEGKGGKRKREENKERVLERERVYLLSRFSDDRSVESWQDKRQS